MFLSYHHHFHQIKASAYKSVENEIVEHLLQHCKVTQDIRLMSELYNNKSPISQHTRQNGSRMGMPATQGRALLFG